MWSTGARVSACASRWRVGGGAHNGPEASAALKSAAAVSVFACKGMACDCDAGVHHATTANHETAAARHSSLQRCTYTSSTYVCDIIIYYYCSLFTSFRAHSRPPASKASVIGHHEKSERIRVYAYYDESLKSRLIQFPPPPTISNV